jgi:hypothetical protein
MGDQDTMMLALSVEPMGGGDWRWCWYDHNSGKALADGVERSERAAWTEATIHFVDNSDVVVRSIVARAEAAEQRAVEAEAEVERLRAELSRTKMAVATAYTDLPVWSESALAHLSPAERGADEVRAALGRFMRAEANRRKGAAEARSAGEVAEQRAEAAERKVARLRADARALAGLFCLKETEARLETIPGITTADVVALMAADDDNSTMTNADLLALLRRALGEPQPAEVADG